MQEPRSRRTWTFGQTIGAGFAVVVGLSIVMAMISLAGLDHVVRRKDQVIDTDSRLVLQVQKLLSVRDARAAANRGYLLSGQPKYLAEQYHQDDLFSGQLSEIRGRVDTERGRELIDRIAVLQGQFVVLDQAPVRLRQAGASPQAVTAAWQKIDPERVQTTAAMNNLADYQQSLVDLREQRATAAAATDRRIVMALLAVVVLVAALLAWVLTRNLRLRIGTAVGQVQTSSADLQATAVQQAAGVKEQTATITAISTTTNELLSSAREIAQSAQRVTDAAERTADVGQDGSRTVLTAQGSMTEIRRQVDTIVNHTLDLGRRSQRIGAILDIVSELAEQTNILAINSTIEAAGAGEHGRRFAVVADEIRKLADRVAESTKEIRDLIELTRAAVNTTVMAIEVGSKAVDAGSAQVEQVASSFEEIVSNVRTTIEAAQEIEYSTKQQTVGVEHVNVAIANVAQTTRDAQTSTDQTLRTASQLRNLSTRLHELVTARR